MLVWLADAQFWARRDDGAWVSGDIPALSISIGGVQVIGAQQTAIADPAGGGTIDTEARAALAALLGAVRAHGLIAT